MDIERVKGSGHYKISTIYGGYLVHQMYIGYTRREAVSEFRQYIRDLAEKDKAKRVKSTKH